MDIINKEKILEHAKRLVSEDKIDRAIAEYEKILQIDPEDLRVKIKIAELYVKRKQIQQAIKIYNEIAKGYADGGFYLKAVTVYKSILRLNPSIIDVNIALSELYEKMGLVKDALYQYQIVATALEQKNDEAGVLNIRERMVTLDPTNISLKIRLAETYQLKGEVDKAIDVYESLAEQLKNSANTEQLIELYSKVLSYRPERHELMKILCNMYFKRGEWKEILKRMDAAKEFVATDPDLIAMQADIYTRLNQVESAKKKYHELAQLLNEKGEVEGSLAAYENILFLSPEDEEDIAEEIEEIETGALKKIKEKVEDRRKRQAEEDLRREEEARILSEASNVNQEEQSSRPLRGPISPNDLQKLEKDANANYDLGVMYKKMGLAEDANAEFLKALTVYQRMVSGGSSNEKIIKRLDELKTYVERSSEAKSVPAVQVAPQEAKKEAAPKKEKAPKVEKPKKVEPPPQSPNKKKISFV